MRLGDSGATGAAREAGALAAAGGCFLLPIGIGLMLSELPLIHRVDIGFMLAMILSNLADGDGARAWSGFRAR